MKFSIIIPTLNEEKVIKKVIENLEKLKGNFEVIFSDGGSVDNTLLYIEDTRHIIVHSKKGRANQMNTGTNKGSGNVLLFLHCDSVLEEDALLKIEMKIKSGYSVGCLKIKFDSKEFLMKCCGFFSNLRVKSRKIMFGDQGIFMTRSVYNEIGGIPTMPIMEDYQLSINIKKRYKICQANSEIITSSRRFEKEGIIKTMWRMQKYQSMFRKGIDINLINKIYRDIR